MKKLTALGLSTASFLTLALPAFADTNVNPCPSAASGGGLNFNLLCDARLNPGFIGSVITLIFVIATLIALAFLIFGGIQWILSGGDKTKVEAARGTIVAALVGLVIVFLAFFIINFLLTIFGLNNLFNITIPTLKLTQ